ncbi:MAG: 50S ribosomal protein L21 [Nitrospiraceae bacterium]|nr:MAG: 50S ribosomal protein L21 [Nitrospiraceae bacterium]
MMYAIFESGGKQYKAVEGETIKIDKIDNKKSVTFGNVLMVSDGDNISYGNPYIASAKISADVVETAKDKKVLVFHQKLRKNHRKLRGHRQQYTSVKINKITLN